MDSTWKQTIIPPCHIRRKGFSAKERIEHKETNIPSIAHFAIFAVNERSVPATFQPSILRFISSKLADKLLGRHHERHFVPVVWQDDDLGVGQ